MYCTVLYCRTHLLIFIESAQCKLIIVHGWVFIIIGTEMYPGFQKCGSFHSPNLKQNANASILCVQNHDLCIQIDALA